MSYLDYIAQFTTDIIEGPENAVANVLTRLEEVHLPSTQISPLLQSARNRTQNCKIV